MASSRVSEKFLTVLIVVIILVLVAGLGLSSWKRSARPQVDPTMYQVVFLDNGQQYFGHLTNVGTRHPYLTDIYYVVPNGPNTPNPQDQKFNLVKLGNELYGPEDRMYLNPSKIILWQNLRSDSKIVKGIAQEKVQRANPSAQAKPVGTTSLPATIPQP